MQVDDNLRDISNSIRDVQVSKWVKNKIDLVGEGCQSSRKEG